MNESQLSIFGRKIFFVDPAYNITSMLVPRLADLEYEVYILTSAAEVTAVLELYPLSMCFINAEAEKTVSEWMNFVHEIKSQERFANVIFGAMARSLRKSEKESLSVNTDFQGGYLNYSPDMDDLTHRFVMIFESFGAKGRRRYVRADCTKDPNVFARCTLNGQKCLFNLQNISTVGVSCYLPLSSANDFPPNTLLKDFTLLLHGIELIVGGAVITTKVEADRLLLVLLFMRGMTTSIKNVIREFISNTNQHAMDLLIAQNRAQSNQT